MFGINKPKAGLLGKLVWLLVLGLLLTGSSCDENDDTTITAPSVDLPADNFQGTYVAVATSDALNQFTITQSGNVLVGTVTGAASDLLQNAALLGNAFDGQEMSLTVTDGVSCPFASGDIIARFDVNAQLLILDFNGSNCQLITITPEDPATTEIELEQAVDLNSYRNRTYRRVG